MKEWGMQDGEFVNEDFYQAMLGLFDDRTDPWVTKLLEFYEKYFALLNL